MALGNRNSQNRFAQAPSVNIQRSQFDRSFAIKDTFDFDYLVPIFVDEILPGDSCNVTLNMFARLATQKVPIMDNMMIDYFFFFVPNRLVWENWEKFNGAQENPGDSTDFVIPQISPPSQKFDVGSLADKFGLPTDTSVQPTVNALPFRAYHLIWNQWFRDQNLQASTPINKGNGPDDYLTLANMKKRNKKHDYFTSALPWPQKGPSIQLPMGGDVPVVGNGNAIYFQDENDTSNRATMIKDANNQYARVLTQGGAWERPLEFAEDADYSSLTALLSEATFVTINQVREAFAMQSLFELDAQAGTRYTEILQAHFKVTSPDFRLQRAEYLGGGSTSINSHPVAQTAGTSPESYQAQLAAFGTSATNGQNIGFTKSFVEHGYVIGMACARADVTYQQGLNRMWARKTRYDFFWPKLQDIGEQAVMTNEIYYQYGFNDQVFGYQERYAEYRYKPSEIHGQFRSTYENSLDVWHMAQEFEFEPTLGPTFIEQNTPIDRAIAVTNEPHLLFDAYFNYKHARPMAVRSIPASLGRF